MAKEIACITCVHYREGFRGHNCVSPETRWFSHISGERYGEDCYQMRMVGGKCGPDAALYAPKPKSLWERMVLAFTKPDAFK